MGSLSSMVLFGFMGNGDGGAPDAPGRTPKSKVFTVDTFVTNVVWIPSSTARCAQRSCVLIDGEWKWPCPRCSKSYHYKRSLQKHLAYECGVDPQFNCQICTKKFAQKSCVLIEGEWKWSCRRCSKSYRYKGNLQKHLTYECGVLPKFACPVCGRRFAYKATMRNHYLIVHDIPSSSAALTPVTREGHS
ncbi:unnamed protein product [Cyprideis torosa]|uniref:Uncharacterized protein n=1 Tax=Cyprideis torosa TaxID=163714 RepID=A0A7R8W6M1_9CRUS|nr:unnamed protein product [Cyprideis torosa]CAG0882468.1 unnamed protein product [Cyprideis torosa]